MPVVFAISVSPTWAVPLIVGAPVARLFGLAATAAVARAGQRLLVGSVVGEAHPHLDRLANVVSHKGVGGGGLALNVRVVSQPLVAENSVGQPVLVV